MEFFTAGPQRRPQHIATAILMVSGYSAESVMRMRHAFTLQHWREHIVTQGHISSTEAIAIGRRNSIVRFLQPAQSASATEAELAEPVAATPSIQNPEPPARIAVVTRCEGIMRGVQNVPEGPDAPSDLRYGRLFTWGSSGATYMVLSVFRSFYNKLRATKSVAFPASASSRVHGLRVLRQGLSLTGEYVPMSPQEIINIPASEVLEIGVLLAQQ